MAYHRSSIKITLIVLQLLMDSLSDAHQRLLTCRDLRVVQSSLKDDGEFIDKGLS